MFKFNFSDLDTEENYDRVVGDEPLPDEGEAGSSGLGSTATGELPSRAGHDRDAVRARELSIDELVQALPPAFSYSPIVIPLSSSDKPTEPPESYTSERNERSTTLLRRDLFDARYQLISESSADTNVDSTSASRIAEESPTPKPLTEDSQETDDALKFIDNPSDLVPGVYEGGLKTWECSLDLVDCLSVFASEGKERESGTGGDWVRGKRIIEIGCGTAIPSLYLLRTVFSRRHPQESAASHSQSQDASSPPDWTEFVLQDYNELVLKLVTFPNVLLTWYASPLAETYRAQHPPSDEDEDGNEEATAFDPTQPGDLQITPDLLTAFRSSLEEQRISIRFIAGSWQSLAAAPNDKSSSRLCTFPFDITLTSETIYQTSSLPSLIDLLKRCSSESPPVEVSHTIANDAGHLLAKTQDLSIEENDRHWKEKSERGRLCLVAAKVLYFGVGGGVMEFERAVREAGGTMSSVLEHNTGVGRRVMSVEWT